MAGIAEILEQNAVLRADLEGLKAEMRALKAAQAAAQIAHQLALAKQVSKVRFFQARTEELERALRLIELSKSQPASQRHVDTSQEELGFLKDIEQPPRLPTHVLEEEEEEEETEEKDKTSASERKGSKKKGKKSPKRRNRDAFSHLPSRVVRCTVSKDAACAGCGGALQVIGQALSFRIEWIPGHFIVEDVKRDKCACPQCPSEGILTVPGPYALERSLPGNALLARVVVDKFCDHLPLARQCKRMAREGFVINTNTMASWVKHTGSLFRVVADCIRRGLLKQPFLQGDDTGFPVQDGGDGKLRKGRFWAFTDQEQVFYAFTPTKEGVYPAKLLTGFEGELLLVDGGSEFNRVVREQKLKRGGCWSHLRTYFFRAITYYPDEAKMALATIRDLFMIERRLKGESPEKIKAFRQEHARPLVDKLFEWIRALATVTRPTGELGKALTYATNQEAEMRLFLDNGELPMHNNLSELMLRQAVVGRKNWLFAGSVGGAQAAATMYTLVGSCMLQGIDPQEYLLDLLNRLPDHPMSRVEELTPLNWRLAREDHTVEQD